MSSLQRTTDNGPRTKSPIDNRHSAIDNRLVRLRLVGANPSAVVVGADELPGKANYFIGNDPKRWRTNVPTYARVRYRNVYPGVDLEYHGNQAGQLEYDFIVGPGADPSAITLDVGAGLVPPRPADQSHPAAGQGRPQEPALSATKGSPLRINRDGDLVMGVEGGAVRRPKRKTLAPEDGFNNTVTLTCCGAPSESTCTLTPSSMTLSGTASGSVAVAVSTTAPSLAPPHGRALPPSLPGWGLVFWLYGLVALAGLAALAGARARASDSRVRGHDGLLAAGLRGVGLLMAMLWCACGPGPQAIHTPGTPAGTYTIDVTGTVTSTGTSTTLNHDFKFTLTVE